MLGVVPGPSVLPGVDTRGRRVLLWARPSALRGRSRPYHATCVGLYRAGILHQPTTHRSTAREPGPAHPDRASATHPPIVLRRTLLSGQSIGGRTAHGVGVSGAIAHGSLPLDAFIAASVQRLHRATIAFQPMRRWLPADGVAQQHGEKLQPILFQCLGV